MKEVKRLKNGNIISQGAGKFDNYCVFIDGYAPRDEEYFNFFIEKSKIYGKDKIYSDFKYIYSKTGKDIDKEILTNIEKFSSHYKNDAIDFERWFTIIYLGMIAEENKKNAILGKKIKGLAMYQIMMVNFSAKEAANYSKGKKASELLKECNAIGIY